MLAGVEFVAAAVEFAGGDDFGGVVEIVASTPRSLPSRRSSKLL